MARAITVNIATGGSLSAAGQSVGNALVGIVMPAAWTTANLTFQVSQDGVTYQELYDNTGTAVTVTTAASYTHALAPAAWMGFNYIKVRSGTSGSAVTQTRTGGTDIILIFLDLF
jgi:hypothetical protein